MKTELCLRSKARKSVGKLFLSLAAIAVSLATSHAAILYTSNGFEASGGPPTFTLGTIIGQNGGGGNWSNVAGTSSNMVIENTVTYAGTQAFGLLNSTTAETARLTLTTVLTGDVFVDGYVNPPAIADISAPLTLALRTSSNSILAQIRFLNTGKLGISGNTLTNYTYNQGTFNRLTVGINSVASTYTVYLNGQSYEGGEDLPLGTSFSNLGRIDFSYTANTNNPGGGYVDNLAIYDANPIPEPAATALLGTALFLLMVLRLRGQRNLRDPIV